VDDRQRILENRRLFREKWIPKFYIGQLHGLFILLLCSSLCAFCFYKVDAWNPIRFFSILGFFIFANVSTYLSHRYPQHHPMKFQKFLFWFHTQEHHSLFNAKNMERDSWADAYMVFFPPTIVLCLLVVFCFEGWIVGKFLGSDYGFICTATLSFYYLLYEFIHFVSHSSSDSIFYRFPGLKFLSKHHRIHHDPKWMTQFNFDIACPLSDLIFGTLKK
jgi:hypothetical protein